MKVRVRKGMSGLKCVMSEKFAGDPVIRSQTKMVKSEVVELIITKHVLKPEKAALERKGSGQ